MAALDAAPWTGLEGDGRGRRVLRVAEVHGSTTAPDNDADGPLTAEPDDPPAAITVEPLLERLRGFPWARSIISDIGDIPLIDRGTNSFSLAWR